MGRKVSRFLAIMCFCHCDPRRSFFYKGKQFPVCARCTGILFGYLVGILAAVTTHLAYRGWIPLAVLPMALDGGLQALWGKESTNLRRLFTGVLGGVGIVYLLVNLHFSSIALGFTILNWIQEIIG